MTLCPGLTYAAALSYSQRSMAGIEGSVPAGLRLLRERRHMSQRELAEAAGINSGGLSRIERGTVNPSLETLSSLLGALDADLLDLHYAMQGTEPPPAPPPDPAPGLIEVGDSGIYMSRDAAAELMVRIVKTGAARMDPPPRPTLEEPPSPPLPRPVRTAGGRNEP